ncbi:hypothetical protein FRC02_006547 [Tulasnella sp. 418]|nr:hypothetical protein FRC02_006547 [Tulasnella sp. 418]
MDEFTAMVNDYLRLHDIKVDSSTSTPLSTNAPTPAHGKSSSDSEYVYDVFYFRRENKADVDALVASEAGKVGTVTGLPPWEIYDYMPDDSDADSVPDEADEDSNEENWYTNDYPEEVSDEEAARDVHGGY